MTLARLLLVAAFLIPATALAQAGRFLLAVGDVAVARGADTLRAGVGTGVQAGDTIRVGANSNAQLRMSDESIVALRPGTVFRIDEYVYSGRSDGRETSLFSLLKGGFRTITGAIGRLHDRKRYAVRTATSTIGIRGTHYVLVHCEGDCGQGVKDGTYGGVSDGRIEVVNDAPAPAQFGSNEHFYVADRTSAPQSLIQPPSFLYDRLPAQSRNRGQQGGESSEAMAQSGLNAESRPSETPVPPSPAIFTVTEERTADGDPAVLAASSATAPAVVPSLGALGAFTQPGEPSPSEGGGFFAAGELLTSGSGTAQILLGFKLPSEREAGTNPETGALAIADAGGAGNVINETAANALNASWGRWIGGTFQDSSGTTTLSSTNQFHYLYGPLTPPDVVAGKTGAFALTDTGFGTTPTNSLGQTGVMVVSPGLIDFTNRSVTLGAIQMIFAASSTTWNFPGATTPLQIRAGLGAFIDNVSPGTCGGGPCITSTPASLGKTGIILGPNGDHLGLAVNAITTSGAPMSAQATRILSCQSAGC